SPFKPLVKVSNNWGTLHFLDFFLPNKKSSYKVPSQRKICPSAARKPFLWFVVLPQISSLKKNEINRLKIYCNKKIKWNSERKQEFVKNIQTPANLIPAMIFLWNIKIKEIITKKYYVKKAK
ncbi:MAG: hypothetical protein MJ160_06490, partial [Treponema sp.]|nr:hypothetical protein [Treponema sp.]